MKLFFAGINPNEYPEVFAKYPESGYLISYAEKKASKTLQSTTVESFLDCGAYTAFRTGKIIERQKYLDFVTEHQKYCSVVAYLDVIGNAEESFKNYEWFLQKGMTGIPTFHLGSPWHHLEMLLERWRYIAIGGVAWRLASRKISSDSPTLLRMLAKCHEMARQRNVLLHGFGITSFNLLASFPWHSVDSTTPLIGSRFGHLLLPKWRPFKIRQFFCDNGKYKAKRSEISKMLSDCPFQHGFRWSDLFENKNAARNRVAFNCIAMAWCVRYLTKAKQ